MRKKTVLTILLGSFRSINGDTVELTSFMDVYGCSTDHIADLVQVCPYPNINMQVF